MRMSNITKSCGVSAYDVFQFLFLLVFQGKNLFRFLNSKHKNQAVSKKTYYRFLNETSYNCSRFIMLLARVFDHVEHKWQKGFTLLTLGWSDEYSFIPTGFNMFSSANWYKEVSQGIDRRTNGFKFPEKALCTKQMHQFF